MHAKKATRSYSLEQPQSCLEVPSIYNKYRGSEVQVYRCNPMWEVHKEVVIRGVRPSLLACTRSSICVGGSPHGCPICNGIGHVMAIASPTNVPSLVVVVGVPTTARVNAITQGVISQVTLHPANMWGPPELVPPI